MYNCLWNTVTNYSVKPIYIFTDGLIKQVQNKSQNLHGIFFTKLIK